MVEERENVTGHVFEFEDTCSLRMSHIVIHG